MSELSKRVLFGVPAAALFIYLTWLGGWYFHIPMILVGMMVVKETLLLFRTSGQEPNPYFPYSIALWVLLLPVLPHAPQIGLILLLLIMLLQLPKPSEQNIRTLGSTLFAGLYGPLGILTFLYIRFQAIPEEGFMLALSLLLMVWGNDVFAYFGGKAFGKHKMAPVISPKKTWEGFISGILGALAGFAICIYLIPFQLPLTLMQGIPAVILISVFGPAGDLSASKLKRASHVKDTSNILPGHGGFLDRFDALILAAPAFYLYLYFLKTFGYVSF
ncbi:phosphatidate cytidylyltransferase [Aliifodinibius sp. S!AR15-10]|uniref:phosphatidate cytidylyltransferase n=1 Tax=Aliifodinibius sp. S!AR15-10 TaxID=2950437 RepID=UPI0028544B7C|nr:phosphatidate cytidylyltransferase [Aliifodinibius sp. S!AR15-10]MDR8393086.1 phosphatidate cytidylyltransferase [Aliifodinibius sp. S!AR15-10]